MVGAQSAEGWAAIAAWITAGVIGGSLFFAWRQIREARRLREAQVRPFVVVDFEAESTVIHLTVENVGRLPAKDVKLAFTPTLSSTFEDPWPPEGSTLMTRGIPTLPPGKKYRFFFDSFPARVEAKLPLTYEAHITYSAGGRKEPFEEPYRLDLTFLLKTREARRRTMDDLATSTDEIVKTLNKWTKDGNGIRAYTVDSELHNRELRIQLMLSELRRRIDAGEVEDVARELKERLVSIEEEGEPPDRWVKKLEAGENFRFSADELEGP